MIQIKGSSGCTSYLMKCRGKIVRYVFIKLLDFHYAMFYNYYMTCFGESVELIEGKERDELVAQM